MLFVNLYCYRNLLSYPGTYSIEVLTRPDYFV